jgi:hypothetical protein
MAKKRFVLTAGQSNVNVQNMTTKRSIECLSNQLRIVWHQNESFIPVFSCTILSASPQKPKKFQDQLLCVFDSNSL